jgi:histidinol-phosphate aminotransferase
MPEGGPPVRVRAAIAQLPPYRQGRQAPSNGFKLSSNENPFQPLPGVVDAAQKALRCINRYPDATAVDLTRALAQRHGVPSDSVHVAAGSVSIIAQLILATAEAGDEVIFAWRSFEGYPGLVTVAGAVPIQVPLTPDGRHDLGAMAAAVTDRTRLILVCSPNNPTGTTVSKEEFAAFHDRIPRDTLILLDEAYAEFVSDPRAVNGMDYVSTRTHDNVVVLRTFSKAYGLAGLRVGYAVGHPRILAAARATAIPLSVTALAEAAALASLDAESDLLARVATLVERRDRMAIALRDAGWRVPDAQGNFVWLPAEHETESAATAFEETGLVVRPFSGEGIRVSVGEEESVDLVLRVASSLIAGSSKGRPGSAATADTDEGTR